MLVRNKLKEKINKGEAVIGTWNTLSSPLVTEVLAQSGLDFQIIDLEHGPFAMDQVHLHVSSCEGSQCTPLVRIPENSDWMALQVLDQGAYGVVVPHIESLDDAKALAEATKYYPKGSRGFTPFSKAGGYSDDSISEYVDKAIYETLNIVIIESKKGLENLEEILKVDAIDVVYFGAYDLSQALGFPGDMQHPSLIQEIQQGIDLVNNADKYAGGFVPKNKEDVQKMLNMGMKFITYEVDSSLIHKSFNSISSWFSEIK